MNCGLKKKDLDLIIEKIRDNIKIEKAVIFGSRAMGNFKKGSDVDIVLYGSNIENEVRLINHELNERTVLPYYFDVLNYNEIENFDLKKHINKFGKVIFDKNEPEKHTLSANSVN